MCTFALTTHTLTRHKRGPVHTRCGPQCLQPGASLLCSFIHLGSAIFSPQRSLSAPSRDFQPYKRALPALDRVCTRVSIWLHCVRARARMHFTSPLFMLILQRGLFSIGPSPSLTAVDAIVMPRHRGQDLLLYTSNWFCFIDVASLSQHVRTGVDSSRAAENVDVTSGGGFNYYCLAVLM